MSRRPFHHSYSRLLWYAAGLVLGYGVLWAVSMCQRGCSRDIGDIAVPRPEAYPRIELYDTLMSLAAVAPRVNLCVNAQAAPSVVRSDRSVLWVDVAYPRYHNAVLRYSLRNISSDSIPEALNDRLTRIKLNVGTAISDTVRIISEAGVHTLIVSAYHTPTPIQCVSTDSKSYILSGVVQYPDSIYDPEILRPALDAIRDDMVRTARFLTSPRS